MVDAGQGRARWSADDIANYWDEDHYVFIVDRAKEMIISGGENIYSVQVEEAINVHPASSSVSSSASRTWSGGEVVKAPTGKILKRDLRARYLVDNA